MARVELSVRIFAIVHSERLKIKIEINIRENRILMQLKNRVITLIKIKIKNGSFG